MNTGHGMDGFRITPMDVAESDTGTLDAGTLDAGAPDAGALDVGSLDEASLDVVVSTDQPTTPDAMTLDATMPVVDRPDAGPLETYPAGPYGSSVGRLFEPFALTACNREGAEANWRFDQPDFYSARLTILMISAMWCVPCQNEATQVEAELVARYRNQGVRIVQLLVQDPQRRAITPSQCQTWVNRYALTFPVLMDPQFTAQPFVPMAAFPGNVIVDRRGRIRWREYGSERGLISIREAIDEVLANPDGT